MRSVGRRLVVGLFFATSAASSIHDVGEFVSGDRLSLEELGDNSIQCETVVLQQLTGAVLCFAE
jgi:hypothetical protein